MAVGDAASQVKQTTGGGIITGLSSARIAGKIAAYAIRKKNPEAVAKYDNIFQRQCSVNYTLMKILRKAIDNITSYIEKCLLKPRLAETDKKLALMHLFMLAGLTEYIVWLLERAKR